jgi:ABC-type transport system substrate-binding protein
VGGEDEPSCGLYTRNEWTGLGDGQPDPYGLVGYPGGGNNIGYINPTFDELCLRAVDSLDPGEKKGGHQQAMRLFSQEVPSIILFFRPKIALIRPIVVGFGLDSTQPSALWNAETLDIIP